jgi:hypothetical protein
MCSCSGLLGILGDCAELPGVPPEAGVTCRFKRQDHGSALIGTPINRLSDLTPKRLSCLLGMQAEHTKPAIAHEMNDSTTVGRIREDHSDACHSLRAATRSINDERPICNF